jgi:hypothetical protein
MYSFSENNGGILSIKEIQPRCKLVRYKSHPHRLIYRDYVGYCIESPRHQFNQDPLILQRNSILDTGNKKQAALLKNSAAAGILINAFWDGSSFEFQNWIKISMTNYCKTQSF